MKLKYGGMKKLLSSKLLLNVVAIISFLTLIGYLLVGQIKPVILFIMLAIVIFRFTANMIVILGVPMIVASIYYALLVNHGLREGMESESTTNENASMNDKKEKIKAAISEKAAKTTKSGEGTLNMTRLDASGNDEAFEVGRGKKGGQYNVDYASTIEDAYDELNNVLGSDGIKRLTDDTQKLMKQQMQLAEAMKSMGPIVQNIAPMVENLKGMMGSMNDSKGGIGGLMEMAKTMSGSAKKA